VPTFPANRAGNLEAVTFIAVAASFFQRNSRGEQLFTSNATRHRAYVMATQSKTTGLVNISELARIRGVSTVSISKRVKRLETRGELRTKEGPRGSKLVDFAEFERVSRETVDGVRQLNGRTPARAADPVLSREQARRTKADADLKELDRDERLGALVRGDKVEEALAESLRMHARIIDQIPTRAEECASAVTKGGVNGARAFLRQLALDIRDDLADRAIEIVRAEAGGENGDLIEA
jgi:hypothetical protein